MSTTSDFFKDSGLRLQQATHYSAFSTLDLSLMKSGPAHGLLPPPVIITDHHQEGERNTMNMAGAVRINRWSVVIVVLIIFTIIEWYTKRPWVPEHLRGGGGGEGTSSGDQQRSGMISLKNLLSVCIEAARRGGLEVRKVRESVDIGESSKGKTREGANNPVTAGDMLSHRIMYNTILKAFPDINIISEEDDPEKVDMSEIKMPSLFDPEVDMIVKEDIKVPVDEVDVWIDPLDATQEYTENLLHYVTTMVCVALQGKPKIGVIHKPFGDDPETAWGWEGPNHVSKVVQRDVEKNKPKDRHDLKHSRLIVSRSHAGTVHDVAQEVFGSDINVTKAGGAGYKSWEVIRGTQDAYVHVTLIKKWDICAGNAILNALGGDLTTLKGESIDYAGKPHNEGHEKNEGGVIATMHDHAAYVDALKDAMVKKNR